MFFMCAVDFAIQKKFCAAVPLLRHALEHSLFLYCKTDEST